MWIEKSICVRASSGEMSATKSVRRPPANATAPHLMVVMPRELVCRSPRTKSAMTTRSGSSSHRSTFQCDQMFVGVGVASPQYDDIKSRRYQT